MCLVSLPYLILLSSGNLFLPCWLPFLSISIGAMRKFESRYKQIMECLSTEMFGNSQPTGGVFSGDNFASGDTRVPVPLGGYARFGKVGKRKKLRKPSK